MHIALLAILSHAQIQVEVRDKHASKCTPQLTINRSQCIWLRITNYKLHDYQRIASFKGTTHYLSDKTAVFGKRRKALCRELE